MQCESELHKNREKALFEVASFWCFELSFFSIKL